MKTTMKILTIKGINCKQEAYCLGITCLNDFDGILDKVIVCERAQSSFEEDIFLEMNSDIYIDFFEKNVKKPFCYKGFFIKLNNNLDNIIYINKIERIIK